jgi:hypothetical protein
MNTTSIGAMSKHLRMTLARLLVVLASLQFVVQAQAISTPAAAYDADVATAWFTLSLELVKETPGFTPPVASRAFGYLGVTLYEAVVTGMPEHRSLVGQLNDLGELPQPTAGEQYHWPAVTNAALAHITRTLFANAAPEGLAAVDGLEVAFTFEAELDVEVLRRSAEHGRRVAEAIYTWSSTDGGHEGYARNGTYAPPTGLGMWVSTPPAYAEALQPSWGNNRPFVLDSGAECASAPPPAYSEEPGSDFYAQGLEVYQTVLNLTPEQKEIALFWADEPGQTATPPGHWMSILTSIIKERDDSLAFAAEVYAKVGIATADAFIACWYTKYRYNMLRPISYIQKVLDPGWNAQEITDPVITPPYPEYTSGHSVQSAAAAYVLTDLLGDNFAFTDTTHSSRGYAARTYGSFYEAAQEAAISRLYGGIHYREAIEAGLVQGRCIGERIAALDFREVVDEEALPFSLMLWR